LIRSYWYLWCSFCWIWKW